MFKKVFIFGVPVIVIAAIAYSLSKPQVPDFTEYAAGAERKEAFFDYFLPIVREKNQEIREMRAEIKSMRENKDDLGWFAQSKLDDWVETYRVADFDASQDSDWERLLIKIDIVPPSMALAQAANESAWGTSRFALEGYNYFGQWCFEKGCGIVPSGRDTGKAHEVADFATPADSVESYIRNINRHYAYQDLRAMRAMRRNNEQPITGIGLAAGLESYSERGDEYIKELRSMIRFNELDALDPKVPEEQAVQE